MGPCHVVLVPLREIESLSGSLSFSNPSRKSQNRKDFPRGLQTEDRTVRTRDCPSRWIPSYFHYRTRPSVMIRSRNESCLIPQFFQMEGRRELLLYPTISKCFSTDETYYISTCVLVPFISESVFTKYVSLFYLEVFDYFVSIINWILS